MKQIYLLGIILLFSSYISYRILRGILNSIISYFSTVGLNMLIIYRSLASEKTEKHLSFFK